MKVKNLTPVMFSRPGAFQPAIVYDIDRAEDLAHGCSVDYAIKTYGERTVALITAEDNHIVLQVLEEEVIA